MRTYGIGQARATRLRQQADPSRTPGNARPHAVQGSPTAVQGSPMLLPTDRTTTENPTTAPRDSRQTGHEEATHTTNPGPTEENESTTDQGNPGMQNEESHPGITDRVGRPSPAAEGATIIACPAGRFRAAENGSGEPDAVGVLWHLPLPDERRRQSTESYYTAR